MNKKAIIITAAVVLVIAAIAGLIAGGIIDITPKSATEREFGKRVIKAEMVINGYEDTVIEIELYPDVAPKTVKNFVKLCNDGAYEGYPFDRILAGYYVQAGHGSESGAASTTVKGEFSANGFNNPIRHRRGILSMARGEDYNSASSSFFIVACPEGSEILDWNGQYAGFGKVVSGMEVIEAISLLPVNGELTVNPPTVKYIKIVE